MTKAIIRITFTDGSIGYYKSNECVTSFKDQAKVFDKKYAEGLADGINFAIKTYDDIMTKKAEVEVYDYAIKISR